eukprot:4117555-Pleurochrysis_carterae.AAC.1
MDEQRDGEVPRVVVLGQVLEQPGGDLWQRLARADGLQPALDHIRIVRMLLEVVRLCEQVDERLDALVLLSGGELVPHLREDGDPKF